MSGAAAPVPFTTLGEGLRAPPLQVTVNERTNGRLCEAVDASPLPDGSVTLALAGNLTIGAAFGLLPQNVLHVHQRIRCVNVVTVGDTLDVHASVAGVGARRGRAYVAMGVAITRGDELVWDAAGEFLVPGWSPVADLPAATGTALALPVDAVMIGTRSHRFTLASMASFSGRGNFHSDRAVAAAMGHRAPLAQGMHVAAVGLALLDGIRPGWSSDGVFECRFVGETPEGSDVTVDALVAADCVWLHGRLGDGTTVLVARAQVDATG